jgi:peptidylprolyl isomerase domain and WD repeat-containing protein 1
MSEENPFMSRKRARTDSDEAGDGDIEQPSLPPQDDESDDDDVGPMPLPAGAVANQPKKRKGMSVI